jgi:hypothetical protein
MEDMDAKESSSTRQNNRSIIACTLLRKYGTVRRQPSTRGDFSLPINSGRFKVIIEPFIISSIDKASEIPQRLVFVEEGKREGSFSDVRKFGQDDDRPNRIASDLLVKVLINLEI